MSDPTRVQAITRPSPKLMWLYAIRCIFFPPAIIPCYFKYHTLKYRFDNEGVLMSWGFLWREETYLTYARIQDIHISRGLFERWLGLGTIQVQTAAGSATPEMSIVGLEETDVVRDYFYSKMRGARFNEPAKPAAPAPAATDDSAAAMLADIRDDLRAIRAKLETKS